MLVFPLCLLYYSLTATLVGGAGRTSGKLVSLHPTIPATATLPASPTPRRPPSTVEGPLALLPLFGHCYSVYIKNYEYQLCPFANATQRDAAATWNPFFGVLGIWDRWDVVHEQRQRSDDDIEGSISSEEEDDFGRYGAMVYTDGTDCGAQRRRKMTVTLACSVSGATTLSDIREPKTCEYAAILTTPEVCEADWSVARGATSNYGFRDRDVWQSLGIGVGGVSGSASSSASLSSSGSASASESATMTASPTVSVASSSASVSPFSSPSAAAAKPSITDSAAAAATASAAATPVMSPLTQVSTIDIEKVASASELKNLHTSSSTSSPLPVATQKHATDSAALDTAGASRKSGLNASADHPPSVVSISVAVLLEMQQEVTSLQGKLQSFAEKVDALLLDREGPPQQAKTASPSKEPAGHRKTSK
jgi:hypothetical protein